MAVYYDQLKSMKAAKIGTIMPWGGDGNTGFLVSNIPRGWMVCKGQTVDAKDYPLLASIVGDTYSTTATMQDGNGNHYAFPYIDTAATFTLPNISNKAMVDLEYAYLNETKYQHGQADAKDKILDSAGTKLGDLVKSGTGRDVTNYQNNTKTTWQATSDIDFTLNLSGNLYFKFSNMILQAPDFIETVYTLPRKLGINHTPSHSHADSIPTVKSSFQGPMVFRTDDGILQTGSLSFICGHTLTPIACQFKSAQPTTWANGVTRLTYFGDSNYEHTLPRTSGYMEFVQDSTNNNYWSHVPATDWRGTGALGTNRKAGPIAEYQRQTVVGRKATGTITNTEPKKSHKTPAHTGMFPRPIVYQNKPNFYGYTRNGQTPPVQSGITDHPEAMTPFDVAGCTLTENNRDVSLPAGTDLGRVYSAGTGASAVTWTQYDAICPLMWVTDYTGDKNDEKYRYLEEGTQVESVKLETNGTYTVKLNTAPRGDEASGWGSVANRKLRFRWGTTPTALNHQQLDPNQDAFLSHNHGSFEIAQGIGSMAGPPSHTASDADATSLTPDSLENALNIDCDTTQPSLTLTFIIKAY